VSALPLVGIGVDVHAFEEGRELWIGGLHWPGEIGLAGHSDADVVAHAACNALFSAAGLGDLGAQFGTSDPEWAGASGLKLLGEAARRVREAGFEGVLSEAAGAPVRVSAATTDGLGFTGKGEGLAGIATAIVFPRV
jgi:2-C-methyl-D-erythritol 2,4-cyclodiphosphate synthase